MADACIMCEGWVSSVQVLLCYGKYPVPMSSIRRFRSGLESLIASASLTFNLSSSFFALSIMVKAMDGI